MSRILNKMKEWGVGALMMGTSAASLFGGTNTENYDEPAPENMTQKAKEEVDIRSHAEKFRVKSLIEHNPEKAEIYRNADYNQMNMFEQDLDKMLYAQGMAEQSGVTSPEEFEQIKKDAMLMQSYLQMHCEKKGIFNGFNQMRENLFKIYEAADRPTIEDADSKGVLTGLEVSVFGSDDRACYNSVTNSIYNPNGCLEPYMAELAHAVYQQEKSQSLHVLGDLLTHGITNEAQEETYNMTNMTEFETHQVIEPVLWDVVYGHVDSATMNAEIESRMDIAERLNDVGIKQLDQNIAGDLIRDICMSERMSMDKREGGDLTTDSTIMENFGEFSKEKLVFAALQECRSGQFDGKDLVENIGKMSKIQDIVYKNDALRKDSNISTKDYLSAHLASTIKVTKDNVYGAASAAADNSFVSDFMDANIIAAAAEYGTNTEERVSIYLGAKSMVNKSAQVHAEQQIAEQQAQAKNAPVLAQSADVKQVHPVKITVEKPVVPHQTQQADNQQQADNRQVALGKQQADNQSIPSTGQQVQAPQVASLAPKAPYKTTQVFTAPIVPSRSEVAATLAEPVRGNGSTPSNAPMLKNVTSGRA